MKLILSNLLYKGLQLLEFLKELTLPRKIVKGQCRHEENTTFEHGELVYMFPIFINSLPRDVKPVY